MHLTTITLRAALAAAVMSAAGCATIVSDSKYPVSIQSSPAGAEFEVRNEAGALVHSGATPSQVTLEAGAGYFDGERYQVSYRKEGYADGSSVIDSSVDGWFWGNILFGGLIGMLAVDPATGAMYKLPTNTSANLRELPPSPLALQKPAAQTATSKTKEQMLNELAEDKNLSYEEYERRHKIIMRMAD